MRKEKKNFGKLILPIIIVVIFVGSIFGVMIGGMNSEEDITEYNDVIFQESMNGVYSFKIKGVEYNAGSLPSDVYPQLGDVPGLLFSDLNGASKIYVASDEKVNNAFYDFYFNLKKHKNIVISCLPEDSEEERCKNLPLKSCEDAGEGVLIVVIKHSDKNDVNYGNSCLVLQGGDVYTRELVDAILFKYLGVFDGE